MNNFLFLFCHSLLLLFSFFPSYIHALETPFSFTGVIDNPNTTIPAGYYGNLTGNGGFGWKTGNCNRNVYTNSYTFTLDNGNGNSLNYSGYITGNGQVILRSAGAFAGSTAQTPLILSGPITHSYKGLTTIQRGVVELAKFPTLNAIPGDLTILEQGTNDQLRWMASHQIRDTSVVLMNSSKGTLNLNGKKEVVKTLKMVLNSTLVLSTTSVPGKLTVSEFWYGNTKYADGVYTATTSSFIKGNGQLIVGNPIQPPPPPTLPTPYSYRSFNSIIYSLYPYEGRNVALLVEADLYEPTVLAKLVDGIDRAYDYYKMANNKAPQPYFLYKGKATIAMVPSTCGAGCGFLGATGIELQADNFRYIFNTLKTKNQFDQTVFYELGRNFWFYGDVLEYVGDDARANLTTGYAVFMRFKAMEAASLAGAPFGNMDFETFKKSIIDTVDVYLANPNLNWSNTLKVGSSPRGSSADLVASFLFRLNRDFGPDFVARFLQRAAAQPRRTTTQEAVNNFITAASSASGRDLRDYFTKWRWPVALPAVNRPITIPALKNWESRPNESYLFKSTARILWTQEELQETAMTLSEDLLQLTGLRIPVINSATAVSGDIQLTLTTNEQDNEEGYNLEVGPILEISSDTDTGIFWGTRTLLQLLKQGYQIQGGMARDWPEYPERSMMVDNGRKYFSPTWLKKHIKDLSYLKFNSFHFHLSDNEGFHLESSFLRYSAPFLKKAELAQVIELARKYHVTIIPEFDMPGHMGAILPSNLRLLYDDGTVAANSVLNIASDSGYTFARKIFDEYADLFPGKYWHMGGDEVGVDWNRLNNLKNYAATKLGLSPTQVNPHDGFYYFINWMNGIAKAKNKKLRIWGVPLNSGLAVKINTDVVLELWDLSINPNDAIARGYKVMNSSFYPTYYVQGWESYNRPQYSPFALYEQWTPDRLFREEMGQTPPTVNPAVVIPPSSRASVLGGKLHIWSDHPNAQTEDVVRQGIYEKMRAMAQTNWGSTPLVTDYIQFALFIPKIGEAPGINQVQEVPFNVSGVINNPNITIPDGSYANLTGHTSFGWQTGNSNKNVRNNGFYFSVDSGGGNPLNYSGVISGQGPVVFRSAPFDSSCCRTAPLIISGTKANTYVGTTYLTVGRVHLAKSANVISIPQDLTIEDQGNNDVLWWASSEQIADSATLTMKSNEGTLALNNQTETIANLKMVDGAILDTGTGTTGVLNVGQFWYNNKGFPAGTYNSSNASFIRGNGKLIVTKSTGNVTTFKIMPVGDSITYIGSSYRGFLFSQLQAAGYNVDMVGTLSTTATGGCDPHHSGYNGATIGPGEPAQWGDIPATGFKNSLYDQVDRFMLQQPDIIVLLIGINDYTNYQSSTGAPVTYNANQKSPAKLAALIDRILIIKPGVKILVSSLLPVSAGRAATYPIAPFNATIAPMVAARFNAGKKVYFVDLNREAGINPNDTTELYDGLHPTEKAGQKIAQVFARALTPLLVD